MTSKPSNAVEPVLAYARVSTEEQASSGLGLAGQRALIAAEAERRGWPCVEFIADEGYSAKTLNRPGIQAALEALRLRRSSVLVVAKLDRLSRSLLDFATLMERARRERWQLVVLDLALDTTTPSGQLMANVLAAFAQYERELIAQRTSAALQQHKANGVRLGRPRGLPHNIVARVVLERSEGKSLTAIADALNREGVRTAQRGRRWYPSTIQAVLRSAALDITMDEIRKGNRSDN